MGVSTCRRRRQSELGRVTPAVVRGRPPVVSQTDTAAFVQTDERRSAYDHAAAYTTTTPLHRQVNVMCETASQSDTLEVHSFTRS